MAAPKSHIRIVTATINDGNVSFNQVVLEQAAEQPAGVLLAGWEQDTGVYIWLRSQKDIADHSTVQAPLYSRCIGKFSVDDPPAWLGHPTFLPKGMFDPWENVSGLETNTKRAAIIEALNTVLSI